MSFGITDTGFNRKTFNDLITEAQDRATSLYGPDVQLSEDSFFGLLLQLYVFFQDELWQVTEQVYNGAYINTAAGVQLDALVKYANLRRNQAVAATGEITFTADTGTEIPAGTLVASGNIRFTTSTSLTISPTTNTVAIRAVSLGTQGNVPAGTITTIVNPITGVNSISNTEATTGGQDAETDTELRSRYFQTLQVAGKATLNAIQSNVLQVTGVRNVLAIENDTNATVDGLPPHSVEVVVDGGDDTAIAQAILESKPAGIATFGNTSITVQDISNTDRIINFNRPTLVDVWVNITLSVNNSVFPADGDDQVQDIIVDYVNALGVRAFVIEAQLVTQTFRVPGVVDATVTLSTDGITFSSDNIEIASDRKAQTDSNRVVVTIA